MKRAANVLVIDDDESYGGLLAKQVSRLGHAAALATTLAEGRKRALAKSYDVILLDVNLPDGSGLEAIPDLRSRESAPEIIIITGIGDRGGAELAIQNGAWDYLSKNASLDAVKLSLARALQYREGKQTVAPVALKTRGMIGNSPTFKRCLDDLARAAASAANVLIAGETGTGKELFATAVHENSARAGGRFVVVDCAALPEHLVESALFGHEKSAFTGADRAHEGLIRQADGGTLFLDEVGELPLPLQSSFLRVLQEHRFRPVGGSTEVQSDFRLVAATNRDLNRMAEQGDFRQDLLHRLRAFVVELPPLRERVEDISALALHYVTWFSRLQSAEAKGFSPDFLEALRSYNWPGNVRELVNSIERATAAAGNEPILYAAHLPADVRISMAQAALPETGEPSSVVDDALAPPHPLPTLSEFVAKLRDRAEKRYLRALAVQTDGAVETACEVAGLGRSRLYGLLKKHGIVLKP